MTIKISGNTFALREKIKSVGGLWDGVNRVWTLPDYTAEHKLNELRNTPGISVTMSDGRLLMPGRVDRSKPEPKPVIIGVDWASDDDKDDTASIVAAILRGYDAKRPKRDYSHQKTQFVGTDQQWFGAFRVQNPMLFAGFSSLSEMLDYVEAIPETKRYGQGRGTGWSTSDSGWVGTSSMQQALSLARNGWREGAEKAKEAAEVLETDHAQQKRRKHGVVGSRVNVGRMLAGAPDHMVARKKQDAPKVITLFVAVGMLAVVRAEDAILRAACVAAISDLLESNGYSCEIFAIHDSYLNGFSERPGVQISFPVKNAGEHLNIEDVVFSLGHPSVMRRFFFAIFGSQDYLSDMWDSMGATTSCFDDDHRPPPNSYYISELRGQKIRGTDIAERVRSLFPLIVPDNFPIDILGNDR